MHGLSQDNMEREERFKRIKLLKKILSYIPRKTSMHRYPVLNRFADVAKKRAYLWSFRVADVVPSLYAGCVLTLTPMPLILHIILGFMLALVIRSNAMVLMGLPFVSNTITFVFLWSITYKTGQLAVDLLGGESVQLVINSDVFGLQHIGNYLKIVLRWFATMTFGAMILGTICGFILSTIYKFMANRAKKQ